MIFISIRYPASNAVLKSNTSRKSSIVSSSVFCINPLSTMAKTIRPKSSVLADVPPREHRSRQQPPLRQRVLAQPVAQIAPADVPARLGVLLVPVQLVHRVPEPVMDELVRLDRVQADLLDNFFELLLSYPAVRSAA